VTTTDDRRAAYGGAPFPPPLDTYIEKVRERAASITDEDVQALLSAGFSEDAILELTIAAAAGAAGERYDAAMRAMNGSG
jgi:hypothetical protein